MSVSPTENIHVRTAHLGAESTLKLLQLEQRQRRLIEPEQTVSMLFVPERLGISDQWTYSLGDTPINAPPTIDPASPVTSAQGTTITKQLSATDPEGTTIAWDITDRDGAPSSGSNRPTMNAQGVFRWPVATGQAVRRYDIVIRARDRNGGNGNKSDSITLTVNITRLNRAPTLANIGNRTITTGQQITISLVGQDLDNDPLTYDISSDDGEGGTLDTSTGVFVWTPTTAQTRNMTFRVRDPSGASATRTTRITVNNPVVNASRPTIDAISNKALRSGQAGSFTARAIDPDDLAITFSDNHAKISKVGSPTLQTNGKYAQRFAIAATTNNGTASTNYAVTITATATGGTPANETDSTTFNVITQPNGPPVLAAIGDKSIRAGQQLRIELSASDPENNPITFSRSGNKGSISNGVFTWTPGNSDVGNTDITFTARTQVGHSTRRTDTETIRITVSAATASPPEWGLIPEDGTYASTRANAWIEHNIAATDPNNLPISYTRIRPNNNNQLRILTRGDGTKYVRYRLPAANAQREYTIRATATGGTPANERIEHTWTATVNAPVITDSPPTMDAIGDKQVKVNTQLRFTVVASDPDGDTITYSRSPNYGDIDEDTGVFTWTPTTAQTRSVTIKATAGGKSVSETITITVSALVIPVIDSGPADATLAADQAGSPSAGTIDATDPNGRALTFSIVRGNGVISGQNRVGSTSQYSATFRITHPASGASETYTIRAAVNDDEYVDHTWTVSVEEPDYSPNITIISPTNGQTIARNGSNFRRRLRITATKYDGTAIPLSDLNVSQTGQPNPTTAFGVNGPNPEYRTDILPAAGWFVAIQQTGTTVITVSYTDTVNNRAYTTTTSITVTIT